MPVGTGVAVGFGVGAGVAVGFCVGAGLVGSGVAVGPEPPFLLPSSGSGLGHEVADGSTVGSGTAVSAKSGVGAAVMSAVGVGTGVSVASGFCPPHADSVAISSMAASASASFFISFSSSSVNLAPIRSFRTADAVWRNRIVCLCSYLGLLILHPGNALIATDRVWTQGLAHEALAFTSRLYPRAASSAQRLRISKNLGLVSSASSQCALRYE